MPGCKNHGMETALALVILAGAVEVAVYCWRKFAR